MAANLLAGSLIGAWVGARWATRMASRTLCRVLAVLQVLIAAALLVTHLGWSDPLDLAPAVRIPVGVVVGFAIGVVAALMGVAGGELPIPTIILMFDIDIKIAGSPSLAISLPTDDDRRVRALQPLAKRCSTAGQLGLRDRHDRRLDRGTVLGGFLLGVVADAVLVPLLGPLLVLSAIEVLRHRWASRARR